MRSVNFLHNDLLGCNYCDTSSPHNAMHSSSYHTHIFGVSMHTKISTAVYSTTVMLGAYSKDEISDVRTAALGKDNLYALI